MQSPLEHAMESVDLLVEKCDWCLVGDQEGRSTWSNGFLLAEIRSIRTHLSQLQCELFALSTEEPRHAPQTQVITGGAHPPRLPDQVLVLQAVDAAADHREDAH